MPLFISVNNINANNSSYIVKELDIYKVNKNIIKYTIAALTKSLDSIFKE